jgi:hypothetical protein
MGPRNASGIDIFHLLFANDTLIFYGPNPYLLRHLRCLFLCLAISGLKINLDKSKLVPVGNVNNVEGLACILGCKVSSLPTKYLSLPLGASFKAKSIWGMALLRRLSVNWLVGSGCPHLKGAR